MRDTKARKVKTERGEMDEEEGEEWRKEKRGDKTRKRREGGKEGGREGGSRRRMEGSVYVATPMIMRTLLEK